MTSPDGRARTVGVVYYQVTPTKYVLFPFTRASLGDMWSTSAELAKVQLFRALESASLEFLTNRMGLPSSVIATLICWLDEVCKGSCTRSTLNDMERTI